MDVRKSSVVGVARRGDDHDDANDITD